MADIDYIQPDDHEKRMRAAKRYANWHLGSNWAEPIIQAYENPEVAEAELDAEEGVDQSPSGRAHR